VAQKLVLFSVHLNFIKYLIIIDHAIGQWRRWLECVVQQLGGHTEHDDLQDVTVTLDNNLDHKHVVYTLFTVS